MVVGGWHEPTRSGERAGPLDADQFLLINGEHLLVMEAMKMQTAVYAPIAGVIKRLAVSPLK